jgi:predicted AlkP superfamily pyrophosphatase or phosphodiesterase
MDKKILKFNHQNTIVNFSNSILKHYNAPTHHDSIKEVDEVLKGHKKVVVMLFDGLGEVIINKYLKEKSYIRRHKLHTMEATFPPTTVASTTGMLSGLYPIENGWMSWSQWNDKYKCNIEPFTNENHANRERILPKSELIHYKTCSYKTIFEQIKDSSKETKVYDIKPYNINPLGPKSLREANKLIDKILNKEDDVFIYFYWTSPDKELHRFGADSIKPGFVIRKIDRFIKKITKKHKDTLFLSIADHGLITVKGEDLCEHEDLYSLLDRPVSFEKRVCTFFVKENKKELFKELFNKYYGDRYVLLSKDEVYETKLFGEGNKHPLADSFVGDFVSIATTPYSLIATKDYNFPFTFMKGHHAGYTEDEMLINISVYNK